MQKVWVDIKLDSKTSDLGCVEYAMMFLCSYLSEYPWAYYNLFPTSHNQLIFYVKCIIFFFLEHCALQSNLLYFWSHHKPFGIQSAIELSLHLDFFQSYSFEKSTWNNKIGRCWFNSMASSVVFCWWQVHGVVENVIYNVVPLCRQVTLYII